MERRLNKKVETYFGEFKDGVREKATELGLSTNQEVNTLLQFILDYDRLVLQKDDFQKRKRVKNLVPFFDRCCAKRATSEQCTRRKKEGSEFCGTHMKGTPHGILDEQEDAKPSTQKVEVWAQDIQGIIYYIDKFGNVYEAEEVVQNSPNPSKIAKYVKTGDVFSIPEFGI